MISDTSLAHTSLVDRQLNNRRWRRGSLRSRRSHSPRPRRPSSLMSNRRTRKLRHKIPLYFRHRLLQSLILRLCLSSPPKEARAQHRDSKDTQRNPNAYSNRDSFVIVSVRLSGHCCCYGGCTRGCIGDIAVHSYERRFEGEFLIRCTAVVICAAAVGAIGAEDELRGSVSFCSTL